MIRLSFGFFFTFFVTISISANLPPFQSVGDIPYQAHSFNDLDYTLQLISRGVKYFKMDVSLATKQSCISSSTWKQGDNPCITTGQISQQYCCLAMRGDTSSRPIINHKFNLATQFVKMLQDHLQKHSIQKILFFAINFQYDFQFSNALTQNFLYDLSKLMTKYSKLHIGTGSDNFILQYDRICRSAIMNDQINQHNEIQQILKVQQQTVCTQKRKEISSSRFFLQSGSDSPSDYRDFYHRYRNFNVYYKQLRSRCKSGFPNWINKYPEYPLIFWQPSNQKQIQQVIQLFLSPQCKLLHQRNISGLAIASNLDPQMLQFYMKPLNKSSTIWPITFNPNSQKFALQYATLFSFRLDVDTPKQHSYLIIGQQTSQQIGNKIELIKFDIDVTQQKVTQILRKQVRGDIIKTVGGVNNWMAIRKQKQTKQKDLEAIVYPEVSLELNTPNFNLIISVIVQNFIDMVFYRQAYYILRQTSNPTVLNILRTTDLKSVQTVFSFSLPTQRAKGLSSFLILQNENQLKILVSGITSKDVWLGQIRGQSLYKSNNVGFGTNSKLNLKQNGEILLTIQNGACHSGVLLNNGDMNKCKFYQLPEFESIKSVGSLVTVSYFSYNALLQYLMNQSAPITPCLSKFTQYKLMNGKNIQIVDIWSRLFFTSQYIPLWQQSPLTTLFCGGSNYEDIGKRQGLIGTVWSRSS